MKLFSLLLFAAGFPLLSSAQDDPRFSDQAAAEAGKRRAAIRAEIGRTKGDSWAGEYYFGDGMGVNATLMVSHNAGFVFEWRGCLGLYDFNYGSVKSNDVQIDLQPVFKNRQDGFRGFATSLLPVRWGPRHYLVPANEVVTFCNLVNSGAEPRPEAHGKCFLRKGDEKLPVAGRPQLPEKYEAYLLDQPIHAQVAKVGKSIRRPDSTDDFVIWETKVTLDRGSDSGVREGMEFFVTSPAEVFGWVRVGKTGKQDAVGVVTTFGSDAKPSGKWQLSTRDR